MGVDKPVKAVNEVGCLFEFLGDMLFEGWVMLMQWIIPEKRVSKSVRNILLIVVEVFSVLLFFAFLSGVILWITGDPQGKTITLITLSISVVQIGIGIVLRCTLAKVRGPHDPLFKASVYSIDKVKHAPLTMVSCEVQDGELNSGDVVLFLNEDDFSLGMGTVCSIKYRRKDVDHIEKSLLSFSVKLMIQDVQDKPIEQAVSIMKL